LIGTGFQLVAGASAPVFFCLLFLESLPNLNVFDTSGMSGTAMLLVMFSHELFDRVAIRTLGFYIVQLLGDKP